MTLSGMPLPVPLTDNGIINFTSAPHPTDGSALCQSLLNKHDMATFSEFKLLCT